MDWLFLVIVPFALLVIVVFKQNDHINRSERTLDALIKHLGIDRVGLVDREVSALLQANKKIEAIKAYRILTGAGLAAAKEHVESLQQNSRPSA
jgi:ribosomal protein L7/L12